MLSISTPESFGPAIEDLNIEVLPLVSDRNGSHPPGWCTYTYEHEDAPELEVMCGGVNSKTPRAGAVWRQGNLLHFGFEPSPEEMNQTGRDLLLNAICYISRFTEDRPIVHTPCVFVQDKRIFDRGAIGRLLANRARHLDDLKYYLSEETYRQVENKNSQDVRAWYDRVRGYLYADADAKLAVDTEAQALGVSPASAEFLSRAIAGLHEPRLAEQSRRLLVRYAPEGPGARAAEEKWRSWVEQNRSYLFFTDGGGYRWYIDPLAKHRGVPTNQLRGEARASLP
jgi:hypothetical protein